MESLYAQYIKERENKDIIENDKGFATFQFLNNQQCYLQDIFVLPEYRETKIATEMADKVVEMAKEKNCNVLIGSVCADDKKATRNMKVFLAYGMQIDKVIGNMIFLKKDI